MLRGLSINSNGVCHGVKREWIKGIKKERRLTFLCIQETHISSVPDYMKKQLWGGNSFDFVEVEAIGRSGGLITLWDPSKIQINNRVKDKNWCMVEGIWLQSLEDISIINVYAPQCLREKCVIWNSIRDTIISTPNKLWIVCGDFNDV